MCVELLSGRLGTDIDLSIETDIGNYSGTMHYSPIFMILNNLYIFNYTATATPDKDYYGLPIFVTIHSGQLPGTLSCNNFTIIDDGIKEDQESFTIVLQTDMVGVLVTKSRSVIEIVDSGGTLL